MDFISRAAAPVTAKKPDGNRLKPLQVSDFATNSQHTKAFQEEESADDDFEHVLCGMCEVANMSGTAEFSIDSQSKQLDTHLACFADCGCGSEEVSDLQKTWSDDTVFPALNKNALQQRASAASRMRSRAAVE